MNRAVVVALGLACKAERSDERAPPAPPPLTAERVTGDALIQEARTKSAGFHVSRVELVDVRPDGTLDANGYARIKFTVSGAERTSGTGGSAQATDDCPTWTWQSRSWTESKGYCSDEQIVDLHCSVLALWNRAIDDGAPSTGLARVLMVARSAFDDPPPLWTIEIFDDAHTRVFRDTSPDDCKPTAEAPELPANLPEDYTLEEFNRVIEGPTFRAKLKACQARYPQLAATFHLYISGPGLVVVNSIEQGKSELSECLVTALRAMTFPRTRRGSPPMISVM